MKCKKILFSIFAIITFTASGASAYGQQAQYADQSDVQNQYEKNNLYFYSQYSRGYVKMVPKRGGSRNWNLYLTKGVFHSYQDLETQLQQEDIFGVGVLYGVHNKIGIGAYYHSNKHYGGMIRTHIFSWLKLRLMLGQIEETSYNETLTPNPNDRYGKTLSAGIGLDISLFWRLGLTVEGFSSAAGNGGYNNQISYGLTVNF